MCKTRSRCVFDSFFFCEWFCNDKGGIGRVHRFGIYQFLSLPQFQHRSRLKILRRAVQCNRRLHCAAGSWSNILWRVWLAHAIATNSNERNSHSVNWIYFSKQQQWCVLGVGIRLENLPKKNDNTIRCWLVVFTAEGFQFLSTYRWLPLHGMTLLVIWILFHFIFVWIA